MLELLLFILFLIAVPPLVFGVLGVFALLLAKIYPIMAIFAVLGVMIWIMMIISDLDKSLASKMTGFVKFSRGFVNNCRKCQTLCRIHN